MKKNAIYNLITQRCFCVFPSITLSIHVCVSVCVCVWFITNGTEFLKKSQFKIEWFSLDVKWKPKIRFYCAMIALKTPLYNFCQRSSSLYKISKPKFAS